MRYCVVDSWGDVIAVCREKINAENLCCTLGPGYRIVKRYLTIELKDGVRVVRLDKE